MRASRRGFASPRCSAPCCTPERYKKYEELQRSRPTSPRSGTIWIYDSGRLVPHHVRLGLSDANVTEITDGLEPGPLVVLRAREIAP